MEMVYVHIINKVTSITNTILCSKTLYLIHKGTKLGLQKIKSGKEGWKKSSWLKLIAVGLLVRLFFSFWTGNPHDFEIIIRVGFFVARGASPVMSRYPCVEGLGQPIHSYVAGIGYLPAWGLYSAFAYKIYEVFPFSPSFYYFLIKLLPILGDLATTYIIYLLIMKFAKWTNKAEKIALSFFLCPFVILISSVWGMFDSVPILFTLLSLLLMLYNKPHWSAFSIGLAIYFKVVPIIYLPIQLFFVNKKQGISKTIVYLLIALIVPFVLTLAPAVFFRWQISETAVTVLSQTQKTGEALSYWDINTLLADLFPSIFNQKLFSSIFAFPAIRYLWVLGLMVSYFWYYEHQKNIIKDSSQVEDLIVLLKGFSFATIGFLLTRPFIPEQLVLYLLPTVLIVSTDQSDHMYYKLTWVLALAYVFVNLYPFAFAYLLNMNFWTTFNYLATTQPFSTLRYAARFIIAVLFDYILIKLLSRMVKGL